MGRIFYFLCDYGKCSEKNLSTQGDGVIFLNDKPFIESIKWVKGTDIPVFKFDPKYQHLESYQDKKIRYEMFWFLKEKCLINSMKDFEDISNDFKNHLEIEIAFQLQ